MSNDSDLLRLVGPSGIQTLTDAAELGRKIERATNDRRTKCYARDLSLCAGELLLAMVPNQLENECLAAAGVPAKIVD
jgi:hypothetical protein